MCEHYAESDFVDVSDLAQSIGYEHISVRFSRELMEWCHEFEAGTEATTRSIGLLSSLGYLGSATPDLSGDIRIKAAGHKLVVHLERRRCADHDTRSFFSFHGFAQLSSRLPQQSCRQNLR